MSYNLNLPRFPQNVSLTALPVEHVHKHELAKALQQAGLEAEDFNPQSLLEASNDVDKNGANALHKMLQAINHGRLLPTVAIDSDYLENLAFWGSIETNATRDAENTHSPIIIGGELNLRRSVDFKKDLYAKNLYALNDVYMRAGNFEQICCLKSLWATELDVDGDVVANNIIVYDSIVVGGKIASENDLVASHVICESALIGRNLCGYENFGNLAFGFKANGGSVVVGGVCHVNSIEVTEGNLRAGRLLGNTVKVGSLHVADDIDIQTLVTRQALANTVKVEGLYDVGTLECEKLELGPNVKFGDEFYTGEPLAQQKTEEPHVQCAQTP